MGLLDIFKRKQASEGGFDGGTSVGLVSGLRAGTRQRTSQQMLAAWSTSPWFRAVVEAAAYAAAVVPWRIYMVRPSETSREYRKAIREGRDPPRYIRHIPLQTGESHAIRERIIRGLEIHERFEEDRDHAFLEVLAEPNDAMTGIDMRFVTFASLMVVGEIGWAIVPGKLGQPKEIWPVPAHWIVRTPTRETPTYTIRLNGQERVFSKEEFVLFRNPSLANPYGRGSGIGMSLADELETDEYISKFQNTWFINRGRPDIVFTVKGNPNGDSVREAKERFENEYRDVRRGGRSFWTRENVDVKVLEQRLIDAGMNESRTWIKDLVRQVIRIPPEVMGDVKDSNRATIDHALAVLAIINTVPQCERMRAQMQMKIIPRYDERLALGYYSPVPDDRDFQLKAIQAAPHTVEAGEMRRLQGLEDRGEADRVQYMPMNLIPVPAPKKPDEPKQLTDGKQRSASPVTKEVDDAVADAVVAALQPVHFENEVKPEIERTVEQWGNKVMEEIGSEVSFSMLNPLVLEHLQQFSSTKITAINDTTRALVREAIRQGVASGEGAEEIGRRISALMSQSSRVRSITIARTEVGASANFATWGAHSMSGVVEQRQWIPTPDAALRDEHAELAGQIRGIADPFDVDGYAAMYPGGFGVAHLDVNCRCTTRAIIEGKTFDPAIVWRTFAADVETEAERVARAVRRAFALQEADMLRALGV